MDRNGGGAVPPTGDEHLDQATVQELIVQLARIEDSARSAAPGVGEQARGLAELERVIVEELRSRSSAVAQDAWRSASEEAGTAAAVAAKPCPSVDGPW